MNRSLLLKATSTDDSPTPGYLYGEIAKMTHVGMDVVEKVVKFLVDRLQRKEPSVKLKTLNVIKQTCRKGDPTFRRVIQSAGNISAVKGCLQFSGPADPLKGDQPYRAVREAAKETLETIFDHSTEVTASDSALASRIKGYGGGPGFGNDPDNNSSSSSYYDDARNNSMNTGYSSASSGLNEGGYSSGGRGLPSESSGGGFSQYSGSGGGGGFGGSGGNRYGGIGNPNFKDPRFQPKGFMDRVKDRLEEYTDKASKSVASSGIQEWLGTAKNRGGGGLGGDGSNGGGAYGGPGGYNYASNRGANAYGGSGDRGSYQGASIPSGTTTGHWGTTQLGSVDPRSPRSSSQQIATRKVSSASGSDGTYERGLVDELCSRGGVRATPAKDKLDRFMNACKTLDASIVMPILYEKLKSPEWKVVHKSLSVCEALLQGGEEYETYVDYLDEHAEILESLQQSSSHPTVQNRCKKVWVLLYGEDAVPPSSSSLEQSKATATKAFTSGEVNLLDMDGKDDEVDDDISNYDLVKNTGIVGVDSSGDDNKKNNNGGMFGNMEIKTKNVAVAQEAEVDLMGGGGPVGGDGDGKGGANLSGTASVQQKQAEQKVDLVDQLSGLSFSSEDVAQKPPNTGFSFLSSTTTAKKNEGPLLTQKMSSSSADNVGNAFDSLLQDSSITAKQQPMMGMAQQQQQQQQAPPSMTPQQQLQFQMQMQQMMMMQQQQQQQQQAGGNVGINPYGMMMPPQMMMQQGQPFMMAPGSQQQQIPMMMMGGGMTPQQRLNYPQQPPMMGSTATTSSSKVPSPKNAAPKQPDKFDFVSSAMAQMK